MQLLVVVTSFVSAIAAGSASVAATMFIERMGGSIGGVIASSPSTIVIFGIAAAVTTATLGDFVTVLYMSAVGLFGDALFLWLWRLLPPTQFVRGVGGKYAQAALMTAISLGFWMAFAIAMIYAIEPLLALGIPSRAIGAFFWALNVLLGLYTVLLCYIPPLPGIHNAPCIAYISRFLLGAACIGAAVGISSINIVAGGVGSMFPNTFLVSMLTLCLSHGHALPHSAVGPLMLGSVSSPVFAAVMAELLPILQRAISSAAGGIAMSAVVAEIAAIVGVSLPVYHIVGWRKRKHSRHNVEPAPELEATEMVNPAVARRVEAMTTDANSMA